MAWILPTAIDILRATAGQPGPRIAWRSALAALETLIETTIARDCAPTTIGPDDTQPHDPWTVRTAPVLPDTAQDTAPAADTKPTPGKLTPADDRAIQGMVLAGPFPVLAPEHLGQHLATWTIGPWTSGLPLPGSLWQLPAALGWAESPAPALGNHRVLGLLPIDPLAQESFCVVFTPDFCFAMATADRDPSGDRPAGTTSVFGSGSGANSGVNPGSDPACEPGSDDRGELWFSFDPAVVAQLWTALRSRLALTHPHELARLDRLARLFPPIEPHYKTVSQFSQALLHHLELPPSRPTVAPVPGASSDRPASAASQTVSEKPTIAGDLELLQAIAHGVKTPLAAIRTWTRLLLRRRSLAGEALGYLEKIDRECTKQIERFDLIFKAVELETDPQTDSRLERSLAPMSLAEVLDAAIPRWQQQADRHGLTFVADRPSKLPAVASDPALLDRMLSELIENLTRTLTYGGRIDLDIALAGSQLKVQLRCEEAEDLSQPRATGGARPIGPATCPAQPQNLNTNRPGTQVKSFGHVLDFQPETGNLTLNRAATKSLFQAIGGKFIVRQRSQQGEVLTIFLPLAR